MVILGVAQVIAFGIIVEAKLMLTYFLKIEVLLEEFLYLIRVLFQLSNHVFRLIVTEYIVFIEASQLIAYSLDVVLPNLTVTALHYINELFRFRVCVDVLIEES